MKRTIFTGILAMSALFMTSCSGEAEETISEEVQQEYEETKHMEEEAKSLNEDVDKFMEENNLNEE